MVPRAIARGCLTSTCCRKRSREPALRLEFIAMSPIALHEDVLYPIAFYLSLYDAPRLPETCRTLQSQAICSMRALPLFERSCMPRESSTGVSGGLLRQQIALARAAASVRLLDPVLSPEILLGSFSPSSLFQGQACSIASSTSSKNVCGTDTTGR